MAHGGTIEKDAAISVYRWHFYEFLLNECQSCQKLRIEHNENYSSRATQKLLPADYAEQNIPRPPQGVLDYVAATLSPRIACQFHWSIHTSSSTGFCWHSCPYL